MRGLSEQFARFRERLGRQEFEKQRHEIGQFVRRDLQGRRSRTCALRSTMAWPRSRLSPWTCSNRCSDSERAAVEQQAIALLQVVDLAGRDILDQTRQGAARRRRHQLFLVEQRAKKLGRGLDQLLRSDSSEARTSTLNVRHHAISIGFLALRGEPNRLVSLLPPEQPLPKEKPQEPRMS